MYKDKEAQKEANREKARRHRERVKGVTEGVTQKPEIVTPVAKGVTEITPSTEGVTQRINPANGMPYRFEPPARMVAGVRIDPLTEYEHKWGQTEPVYKVVTPREESRYWAERVVESSRFYDLLASKKLENDVRLMTGPTVGEMHSWTQ